MKRFKMLSTAGAVVLLGFLGLGFISKTALAAIPQLINTQGVLRDGSGNPVPDASYSTTFRIYDAASAGTVLWSETQSVATLGGQFNVNLGSVTPIPNSVFDSPNRWLGIQVSPDPEMTPRQRLVSVGYSYRVSSVDGAMGGAISGNISLDNSTAATGNIFKGGSLFLHNHGFDNIFIGRNAGNLTMTGIFNTASGTEALNSNTTGGNNAAYGFRALWKNTTGSNNAAGGAFALASNTIGIGNTAFGPSALSDNIDGSDNTAIGYQALANNTTDSNTAVGASALFFNTTGFGNSATGFEALRNNTTGDSNSAFGFQALRNNTVGDHNTASGFQSLRNSSTGSLNTAIGNLALYSNTTGNSNTAVGDAALGSSVDNDYNTAIGYLASNGCINNCDSNTSLGARAHYNGLGHANTAIGVGTIGLGGGRNTACGTLALGNINASNNTAFGYRALISSVLGTSNTAIGFEADVSTANLFNATAIGAGAVVNASNKVRIGNSSVTVIEGQVGFTASSDKNQKENFRPVNGEEVLRKIRDFKLTSWNFIGHDPKQFRHYGPMAQDFFAAFGDDGIGKIGTETTINSGDMAGILMIAVQALGNENADLKTRIEYLEEKLKEIQAEMPQAKVE